MIFNTNRCQIIVKSLKTNYKSLPNWARGVGLRPTDPRPPVVEAIGLHTRMMILITKQAIGSITTITRLCVSAVLATATVAVIALVLLLRAVFTLTPLPLCGSRQPTVLRVFVVSLRPSTCRRCWRLITYMIIQVLPLRAAVTATKTSHLAH